MKNKYKKKYVSTYELRKEKYPYSFRDGINSGTMFSKTGLKEPAIAEEYMLEFFNITKNLLEGNYKIIDCLATFIDDDFGSYGEMEIVKDGQWISEGIEKWKDYYLNGPGRNKREKCKDLIDICVLHMNLKHIKGKPSLKMDSYWVSNETDRIKKKKNKFHLHNWSGVWVAKNKVQLPNKQSISKKKKKEKPKYNASVQDIENCRAQIIEVLEKNKDKIPIYEQYENLPKTQCHIWYKDESKSGYNIVHPSIPEYIIKAKHAKKMGFNVCDGFPIVHTQDIEGNWDEFAYDIRTLQFREINPNCNLDKLMSRTKSALSRIEKSFLSNNDIFIKALLK